MEAKVVLKAEAEDLYEMRENLINLFPNDFFFLFFGAVYHEIKGKPLLYKNGAGAFKLDLTEESYVFSNDELKDKASEIVFKTKDEREISVRVKKIIEFLSPMYENSNISIFAFSHKNWNCWWTRNYKGIALFKEDSGYNTLCIIIT